MIPKDLSFLKQYILVFTFFSTEFSFQFSLSSNTTHMYLCFYPVYCFSFNVDWFGTTLILPEVNTHFFSFINIQTLCLVYSVSPLQTKIPAAQLRHSFCEFFSEKIKQVRQNLDNISPHVPTVVPDITTPLVQFSPVSEKEVHNIFKKTAQKLANLTHCQHHCSTKTLISFFQFSQTV